MKLVRQSVSFFIDTFVSLAIPSLQLRLTTSLFSNLDSTLKTNTQYISIVHCSVLVLICSYILLRFCLTQIPLALCSDPSQKLVSQLHRYDRCCSVQDRFSACCQRTFNINWKGEIKLPLYLIYLAARHEDYGFVKV
jgi:hypothetical protein